MGSESAIKRFCRQLARTDGPRPEDVAFPVTTPPGEVAQVDYCYGGKRYDAARGVMRKTWIFIMTLGHSRLTYAELVYDQSVGSWIDSHINAFEFFGGVPQVVVPDNLKAALSARPSTATRTMCSTGATASWLVPTGSK